MILQDLKDQLAEKAQVAWAQIQESSLYMQIQERYENLNPTQQKITFVAGVLFAAFMVISIPWSYLSSSSTYISDFEANRQLIRDLFRVSRMTQELASSPEAILPSALQARVQNELHSANLLPEQIKRVEEYNNAGPKASSAIPKSVEQKGVLVHLAQLNLRQVVDIGQKLQNIDKSIKMIGLDIHATAADPHYYDTVYKLISFSLPTPPEPPSKKK